MIIHCTKKLAAKLHIVSGIGLVNPDPLGIWHANLYLIDKRNCVMFCHDQTRFILFVPGLKKADFANLDFWFQELFANTMLKLDYEPELIEAALSLVDELQFDTVCDRSVQGTMRVAVQDIDAMLWDLPMYTVSARLCNRPVRTKGMKESECLWPADAMKDHLQDITGVSCN